jgi:cytochrome c556
MNSARVFRLAGVALLAAVPLSAAHEGATGIIKERMDAMQTISQTMKSIRQQIEANRNLAAVPEEAARIQAIAKRIPSWFPPGSITKPTDALPVIWQRWGNFRRARAGLNRKPQSWRRSPRPATRRPSRHNTAW